MTHPFGDWLEVARQKRGMSQRMLATRAGVSSAMVSKIESGSGLSLDMARKLAAALDIPRAEAERAWAAGNLDTGALPEIVRIPDLSYLQESEDYRGLPEAAREYAEEAFMDGLETLRDAAIGIALVKLRRGESIGGVGDN